MNKHIIDDINAPKMRVVYAGDITDSIFQEKYRSDFDKVFSQQGLSSVDDNAEHNKLVIAFEGGLGFFQHGTYVLIVRENYIDPKKYYPKGWKYGDSIPAETVCKIVSEKLGFSYETFMELSGVKEGEFSYSN